MKTYVAVFLFLFSIPSLIGQQCNLGETVDPTAFDMPCNTGSLSFIENKNQWEEVVNYSVSLGGLDHLFLEDKTLTYVFYDKEKTNNLHDLIKRPRAEREKLSIAGHAYQVHFLNALKSKTRGWGKREAFNNYFLGNDPAKWASNVPVYEKVSYDNIYEGIQLAMYSKGGHLKYDFIVAPQADPALIQLQYEGTNGVCLENGDLHIQTSVGLIKELAPYAYQIMDNKRVKVNCRYVLENNVLTFEFPDAYEPTLPLIIDPELVVATLSKTGAENFGHCATYDNQGNIYTAGISFSQGYVTTIGAFSEDFNGGFTDIVISKYNKYGSHLLYATYLGGDDEDYPQSIITDVSGQLFIYGSTSSDTYPVASNAVQPNFGGSTDIVVSKLNASGSILLGSTFVGGSFSDGRNYSNKNFELGDEYRGEIVLDKENNVYIASGTNSSNFPTSPNAFRTTISGNQDGVVLKLNSDLSVMDWATFIGSDQDDFCTGLRVDDDGSVFVVGFAGGGNLPIGAGGIQDSWPGGFEETAFVMKLSSDGTNRLNGTFWGTPEQNRGYFIDIDNFGQVHIFGLSLGQMPVTPGTYSFNEESTQFISGFSNDLSTLIYSTVIGSDQNSTNLLQIDFMPVAFLVDNCNKIYFSGYYASEELPVTADAFSTEGDAFYIGVLEAEATDLVFGSYYQRANHVDGGTSRFDKNGIIYQGVCSCNSYENNTLQTTPGAWATSQSTRCDVGVFKIDFESESVTAIAQVLPENVGCAPFAVDFVYTGQNADNIFWDFGTGDTSTEFDPSYVYTTPGNYTVTQIVNSPSACNQSDTFRLEISVSENANQFITTSFCKPNSVVLDATSTDATYLWQDNSTAWFLEVDEPGLYWVEVTVPGCKRRDSFLVTMEDEVSVEFQTDDGDCTGTIKGSISSFNTGGTSPLDFIWSNGSTSPDLTNLDPGNYSVTITNDATCQFDTVLTINSIDPLSFEVLIQDLDCDKEIKQGQIEIINAAGGTPPYRYSLNNQALGTNTFFDSLSAGSYEVVVEDAHACIKSEVYEVFEPLYFLIDAGSDIRIELGEEVNLNATIFPSLGPPENQTILWSPALYLDCDDCPNPSSKPINDITYFLSVQDNTSGCFRQDSVKIFVDKPRNVYIPNAISPNGDGINETFYIHTSKSASKVNYLKIFNRWGAEVFAAENFLPNSERLGWDGHFKGKPLSPQVLVYIAEVEFWDGLTIQYQGDLLIFE